MLVYWLENPNVRRGGTGLPSHQGGQMGSGGVSYGQGTQLETSFVSLLSSQLLAEPRVTN